MNDIHPLKPMIEITYLDTWLPWVLGVFILFIILFVAIVLWKKYGQTKSVNQKPNVQTVPKSDIVAIYITKLNKTQAGVSDSTELRSLLLTVTDILKTCLAEVYETTIRELTTTEISNNTAISFNVKNELLRFLDEADKLKFSIKQNNYAVATQPLLNIAHKTLQKLQAEVINQSKTITPSGNSENNHLTET